MKLFYRTQRDLACDLNKLVDAYWNDQIEENDLIYGIQKLHENNKDKLLRSNQFTKVVQQQCGKRRLAVVEKVLTRIERNL